MRPSSLRVVLGAVPTVAPGSSVTFFIGGMEVASDAVPIVSDGDISVRKEHALNGVLEVTVTAAPSAAPRPRTIIVVNPGPYGVASGPCVGCVVVGSSA